MRMTNEERLMFAKDSLRNTLADMREYLRMLRNNRAKHYDQEYINYLKAKYFDRRYYVNELIKMYQHT